MSRRKTHLHEEQVRKICLATSCIEQQIEGSFYCRSHHFRAEAPTERLSWRNSIKQWWKSLRTPKPIVAPKPLAFDFNKHLAQVEHEERESYAYNPTAFWLDPLRWSDNDDQPFWMKQHDPVTQVTRTSHLPMQLRIDKNREEHYYHINGQPHEDYYLGSSQMNPPTLYHTAEDREFAEFYRSKYKTIRAFRRAKTMRSKDSLT